MQGLELLDWIVVGLYFAVVLGIAWWVIRQKQETTTDYFLAGRHVGWFVIGASIFASNIGSEHIVGLAGTAAKTGRLELGAADQAFPALVKTLLPTGLRRLVVGGLLAALMSSLAAVFNSCSTLFTMDIYKKVRPNTSEKSLVRVGRIATRVVVVLGILWIPFMKYISGELYHYLQSVQSYLAPPITAVFLLGIFWKGINAKGALSALISGFSLGMVRLIMELNKHHLRGMLFRFADVNFLYFCVYLFLFCVGVMAIVSVLTKEKDYEKIRGLTYGTTVTEDRKASRATWNKRDVLLSLVVLIIIALVMIYFSPLVIAR